MPLPCLCLLTFKQYSYRLCSLFFIYLHVKLHILYCAKKITLVNLAYLKLCCHTKIKNPERYDIGVSPISKFSNHYSDIIDSRKLKVLWKYDVNTNFHENSSVG